MRSLRTATATLVATGLGFITLAVSADTPPSQAQRALEYRQSLYHVIAWNFAPMGAMAQGKVPYDARAFALRAERVAAVAPMLKEAFPPETKGLKSDLLPVMWDNRADFDQKLDGLIERTAALATAAKTGDFEKSKSAFFEVGNACKGCHEKYRKDD